MNRNFWIQVLCGVMTLGCLVGAGVMVPRINHERVDKQLEVAGEIGKSIPPHYAVATAALGTFRGLLVDVLWYRANKLKDEGKFYEANTLSQFITTLQPRFPMVWQFHAWNMAYNISVATHTKEERWDWVMKGVRLLRDQGIPYNPRAIRLYHELSWIFFHKIGETSDNAHWYYKSELCREWQELLGVPNLGLTTEQAIEAFRPIAEAPDTLEELLARKPQVQAIVDELRRMGYQPDQQLLRLLGRIAMINYAPEPVFTDLPLVNLPPDIHPDLPRLLSDRSKVEPLTDLLAFMRRKVLAEQYRMEAEYMLEVMELFGPVDWRHACAHSLYWSRVGTIKTMELANRPESTRIDFLNTYRQNIFSIQSLMRSGRISFDPITGYYGAEPDPRFIDSYAKAMGFAEENLGDEMNYGSVSSSFESGHENFLLQSAYFSYVYGEEKKAREYYTQAARLYGTKYYNIASGIYTKGLEEWVLSYMKENLEMMTNSAQFIDGAIRRGMREGLAEGNLDRWNYYEKLAQRVHQAFQAASVVSHETQQRRNALPPFEEMRVNVYVNQMQMPYVHPLVRSRIWYNTPMSLRRQSFDKLWATLYAHASAAQLNAELLFPPPPGWTPPKAELDQPQEPESVRKERK